MLPRATSERLGIIAALGACSCTSQFQPVVPHRAESRELTAHIDRIELSSVSPKRSTPKPIRFTVVARTSAPDGARVRRVQIAPAHHRPCGPGVESAGIWLDDSFAPAHPVPIAGAHTLRAEFAELEAVDVLESPTVLELQMERDGSTSCVRVPLGRAPPRVEWQRSIDWSGDLGFHVSVPLSPASRLGIGYTTDAYIGYWLGPFRLRTEFGAGRAVCERECGEDTGLFVTDAFRMTFEALLLEAGEFAWMVGGGYDFVLLLGGGVGLVHGPRAVQTLLWVASPRPTEGSGVRRARLGLELALSRWYASDSAPTFVVNMGLVGGIGL